MLYGCRPLLFADRIADHLQIRAIVADRQPKAPGAGKKAADAATPDRSVPAGRTGPASGGDG